MAFDRVLGSGMASRLFGTGGTPALALLRAAWPHAVGHEVARRSELLSMEGGTLRVRVPDAGWRRVLHRMQPEIVGRLRRLAGDLAPARLGFSEGALGVDSGPDTSRPQRMAASPAPVPDVPAAVPASVAAGAETIDDPEIRARFLSAAARYLSRQQAGGSESSIDAQQSITGDGQSASRIHFGAREGVRGGTTQRPLAQ